MRNTPKRAWESTRIYDCTILEQMTVRLSRSGNNPSASKMLFISLNVSSASSEFVAAEYIAKADATRSDTGKRC